jgi:hypothetical protein
MEQPATMVARLLAERAEEVCRHFLSNGRREGRYWLVGDASNTPGRSLYLRLVDAPDGRGRAGKWTDAQNGDHGDLLDIIASTRATRTMRETLDEARRFLRLPPQPPVEQHVRPVAKAPTGTPEAARRLFAASKPIAGTSADRYLRGRAIMRASSHTALRFHPRCWYRPSEDDAPGTRNSWPAMIAAVTDLDGNITGIHRTWLDGSTATKAPIADPRRAMGHLLGRGVRFGPAASVMAAGEGIETMLSLRDAMPSMSMIAGLSAAHLAAIAFPPDLKRLYVARDDDPAGAHAVTNLTERTNAADITMIVLKPQLDDFNADLRLMGLDRLRAHLARQLIPEDAAHFLPSTG